MPTIVPSAVRGADEPNIGLMHKGRSLQRLPWSLVRESMGGEMTKLFIYEWKKLICSAGVAALNLAQYLCYGVHDALAKTSRCPRSPIMARSEREHHGCAFFPGVALVGQSPRSPALSDLLQCWAAAWFDTVPSEGP